jgi:hypothetical protein
MTDHPMPRPAEGEVNLLPCPFCGSQLLTVELVFATSNNVRNVVCIDCGASGPRNYNGGNAKDRWNRAPRQSRNEEMEVYHKLRRAHRRGTGTSLTPDEVTTLLCGGAAAAPTSNASDNAYYLLSPQNGSGDRLAWWRPHARGYTVHLDEAGKYCGDDIRAGRLRFLIEQGDIIAMPCAVVDQHAYHILPAEAYDPIRGEFVRDTLLARYRGVVPARREHGTTEEAPA